MANGARAHLSLVQKASCCNRFGKAIAGGILIVSIQDLTEIRPQRHILNDTKRHVTIRNLPNTDKHIQKRTG